MTYPKKLLTAPFLIIMVGLSLWALQPGCARAADPEPAADSAAQTEDRPFNPDLGYKAIKETLPQSQLDDVTSIEELFALILGIVSIFITGLLIIAIIYSGIMYITAGGDPDKATLARKNLIWAITGLLVILFSIFALNLLRNTFISDLMSKLGGGL